MDNTLHCNTCNLDFKTFEYYKKHLITNRHIERTTNANAVLLTCKCGRSYSHHQSLYVHRKKCEQYQTSKKTCTVPPPPKVHPQWETEKDEMREKLQLYEKEHDEMKAQLATLLAERATTTTAKNNMINREIVDTTRQNIIVHPPTQLKRKDKRRSKVNMVLRQQIVDRQENTCGYCEQILSSYFQIDHIVGLQFGGDNEESNLMALCCECHSKKAITENRCRKQIKEAVQTIIIRNFPVRPSSQIHQYELIEMGS